MVHDGLTQLAGCLLERFGDESVAAGRPVFLEVGAGTDGSPLGGSVRRRADILGWVAPKSCAAVAAVATGRFRQMDESVEPPARLIPGLSGGLRISCVVDRSGAVGWKLLLPDGSEFADVPEEGRMLDSLRRCLGLPTPPPPCPMGRLHSITWMRLLKAFADQEGCQLAWCDALNLHPVVLIAREFDEAEAIIRSQARSQSWDHLRVAIAAHEKDFWDPSPRLASWMDEGMFARWTLDCMPTVEEMLEDVRPRLVPSAARKLTHLVRETS